VKLLRVKPSQIKVPEIRVTAKFDEETRALLKKSVKEAGILAPILVQKIEQDLVLIDGLHRLDDARDNGDQPIDVAVLEGDMVDLLCRNLFLDKLRGKPPIGDMVRVIETLFREYNLAPDQIGERTGLPRDYIEKLIKISTASLEVREALDREAIGVGVAFELSRLPFPIQQEEVLAKSTVYRLRVKDVKELVDATLTAMQEVKEITEQMVPGATQPPRVYLCEGCKEVVEPKYLRPVMVCPTCFGEVWRLGKARADTAEKIEE